MEWCWSVHELQNLCREFGENQLILQSNWVDTEIHTWPAWWSYKHVYFFFTKESGLKMNILGCSFDGCHRRMCHSVDMYNYFIVEKKEGFQSL